VGHVWTAPGWQGFSSRLQHWSEQPCVRPLSAAHLAAGHNALRGSGPGHNRAFEDAVAQVGCPDRQIDRLCITCCSPFPTIRSRRMPDAISSHPKRGGLPVAAALRHQGPRDPRELVSERDGRDLRRPPCQQCHQPGPVLGPMDFGIANNGERSGGEQAAQISIPSFADVAKLVLTAARVLLRNESDPGREVPRCSEDLRIGDAPPPGPWPAVGQRQESD